MTESQKNSIVQIEAVAEYEKAHKETYKKFKLQSFRENKISYICHICIHYKKMNR